MVEKLIGLILANPLTTFVLISIITILTIGIAFWLHEKSRQRRKRARKEDR